ncbi:MAG: RidA family protein [Ardenticatenaceae bacterium]|nr:RidA family protein [Anaerolineales bacterium]MCB8976357.1 RidA family protein [Ardenticatenaceae bacterium]
MILQTSNPDGVYAPPRNYSQAVRIPGGSDMLYISGQGPQNERGETVGVGDMTAQAEQVFHNLATILAAHGATFANVVKATIYLTDVSRLAEFNAVRARFYGAAKPASALLGVTALVDPGWLVEVELVALV